MIRQPQPRLLSPNYQRAWKPPPSIVHLTFILFLVKVGQVALAARHHCRNLISIIFHKYTPIHMYNMLLHCMQACTMRHTFYTFWKIWRYSIVWVSNGATAGVVASYGVDCSRSPRLRLLKPLLRARPRPHAYVCQVIIVCEPPNKIPPIAIRATGTQTDRASKNMVAINICPVSNWLLVHHPKQ